MKLTQLFIQEFEHEMKITERFFQAITDEMLDYRPHEKSMSANALVNHLLSIPLLIAYIADKEELDWATASFPEKSKTVMAMRAAFTTNIAEAKTALKRLKEEELEIPWAMRNGETVFFTVPKRIALRNLVLNHLIHHRAQLGVYLRLNDIPVPASYGGSADQPF